MSDVGFNSTNFNKICENRNEDNAQPPKQPTAYIAIPDSALFNGSFVVDGYMVNLINNNNFGSDETKLQTVTYNDDNTATIQTYYTNEKGTDATVDEVIDVAFEETDWGGIHINTTGINFNIDKNIDYFKQGDTGDCAFLSSLVSFSQTTEGKKILEDAITINNDGSYSVNYKGIEKTVTVTQKELEDARTSGRYSSGDNTVLLYEVTAEKAINEFCDDYNKDYEYILAYYTKLENEEKVEKYIRCINLLDNYKSGKNPIESFSIEKFMQLFGVKVPKENTRYISFPNAGEDVINNLLENTDFNNSVSYLGFNSEKTINSDNNEQFEFLTNHAYTIKSYNPEDKTVTIVNPHNSADSATISVAELKEYGRDLKIFML